MGTNRPCGPEDIFYSSIAFASNFPRRIGKRSWRNILLIAVEISSKNLLSFNLFKCRLVKQFYLLNVSKALKKKTIT